MGDGLLNEPTTREQASARRRSDSRRKLLVAARRLFVERGFHDTRPQDIAKTAGLGHGTFYLHFADKGACFLAFAEEARAELREQVTRRVAGVTTFEAFVSVMLNTIYDYATNHPGVLATIMSDDTVIAAGGEPAQTLFEVWARDWTELLSAGMENGSIVKGYHPVVIGGAIVGLLHSASMIGHKTGVQRDVLVDNLTRFLVRALSP